MPVSPRADLCGPPPPTAERLARLRDEAAARLGDGYAVEVAVNALPPEWETDLALLHRRMSTDAPSGVELEEKDWDEEGARDAHERRTAAGEWCALAVARHLGTGRLVAYSKLSVRPVGEGASRASSP